VEIRPLSSLLPPGTQHLERAILPPAALDSYPPADGRHALSVRGLPLQFRKLSEVQGAIHMAAPNPYRAAVPGIELTV
jgi:hypothetical protein